MDTKPTASYCDCAARQQAQQANACAHRVSTGSSTVPKANTALWSGWQKGVLILTACFLFLDFLADCTASRCTAWVMRPAHERLLPRPPAACTCLPPLSLSLPSEDDKDDLLACTTPHSGSAAHPDDGTCYILIMQAAAVGINCRLLIHRDTACTLSSDPVAVSRQRAPLSCCADKRQRRATLSRSMLVHEGRQWICSGSCRAFECGAQQSKGLLQV